MIQVISKGGVSPYEGRHATRGFWMAIGVFDSGLGGLTVHQAIAARLPDLPLVYLGDNAHAPYGVRTADDIFDLTCKGVERLWDEGCDLVILACNHRQCRCAEADAGNLAAADKRVLGVFVPMIEALTERAWGDNSPPRGWRQQRRAVCHTRDRRQPRVPARTGVPRGGRRCRGPALRGVVDAIEMGDEQLAEALVTSHVEALKRRMPYPEAAVLGCTHYPLMQDAFQRAWGRRSRSSARRGWSPKAWPTI